MLFRKKQQQKSINKLELLKVTVEQQDEASTSAGSGSQRSQEEINENLLTNKAIKTTTIRDQETTTKSEKVEARYYAGCDPDSDCGDLLRRKSAQAIAANAAL